MATMLGLTNNYRDSLVYVMRECVILEKRFNKYLNKIDSEIKNYNNSSYKEENVTLDEIMLPAQSLWNSKEILMPHLAKFYKLVAELKNEEFAADSNAQFTQTEKKIIKDGQEGRALLIAYCSSMEEHYNNLQKLLQSPNSAIKPRSYTDSPRPHSL